MEFWYYDNDNEYVYRVDFEDIIKALFEILNVKSMDDIYDCCDNEGFEDEYDLAEGYRDALHEYFYLDAWECYRSK